MKRPSDVTVLLVEDDEVDKMAFRRTFDKLKLANPLVFAEDGIEALKILRGNDGVTVSRPYLVILDLNMPRMNGHEFLKELRSDKNLKDTVVFVLTTSKAEEDLFAAYEKNIAGYMLKSDLSGSFLKAINMLDHYWRIVVLPNGRH